MRFILDKIVFQNTRPKLNINLEKNEAMTVVQLYAVIITAGFLFDNTVDQWWQKKKLVLWVIILSELEGMFTY